MRVALRTGGVVYNALNSKPFAFQGQTHIGLTLDSRELKHLPEAARYLRDLAICMVQMNQNVSYYMRPADLPEHVLLPDVSRRPAEVTIGAFWAISNLMRGVAFTLKGEPALEAMAFIQTIRGRRFAKLVQDETFAGKFKPEIRFSPAEDDQWAKLVISAGPYHRSMIDQQGPYGIKMGLNNMFGLNPCALRIVAEPVETPTSTPEITNLLPAPKPVEAIEEPEPDPAFNPAELFGGNCRVVMPKRRAMELRATVGV